jgi:hypothetical protein
MIAQQARFGHEIHGDHVIRVATGNIECASRLNRIFFPRVSAQALI